MFISKRNHSTSSANHRRHNHQHSQNYKDCQIQKPDFHKPLKQRSR